MRKRLNPKLVDIEKVLTKAQHTKNITDKEKNNKF